MPRTEPLTDVMERQAAPLETFVEPVGSIYVLDSSSDATALQNALDSLGYTVVVGNANRPDEDIPKIRNCVAALINRNCDQDLAFTETLQGICPVIMISTDQHFQFRLQACRAGAIAVLTPPVNMIEVASWLQEFRDPPKGDYSILIVDDDELLADTYAMALDGVGMRTTIVTDPTRTLEAMSDTSPDLILMDVNMPGVSGLELAQLIRQSRQALPIPIVFLSGEQDKRVQHQARALGGDNFISKPVDLDELTMLVRLRAERAVTLRQVMESDSLTGLLNHARFKDRLLVELERAARTGMHFSLALVDLDRFKTINDLHGHLSGDQVIQTLAHTLTAGLRRVDVIGRYGGEEFAVVLYDAPTDMADAALDRIRQHFSKIEFKSATTSFHATFSVGIASSEATEDASELIALADDALYKAKASGRDRICIAPAAAAK